MIDHGKKPTAVTFPGIPGTDLATGEVLSPDTLKGLIDYAVKYHLDPARGHVVLMYSKPYITIDGYLYYANKSGVPYSLSSRPLDEDERKTYQIEERSHAWVSEVILTEKQQSFTGLGIVTYEEMTATSKRDETKLAAPVVAAHPWQQAQKRAEWQVLRRAFPIGESDEKKEVKHEHTTDAGRDG